MTSTLITPPATEPVTVEEARVACRLTADDLEPMSELPRHIAAARQMAEQQTGQRLVSQTWKLTLDAFPDDGAITLDQVPARAITLVQYTNSAGVLTTVDSGAYRLDTRGTRGVLRPAYGSAWPTDVRSDDEAGGVVFVTYTAGLAASSSDLDAVAPGVREWVLAHVVAMLERPSAVGESSLSSSPYLARLLDSCRVYV